MRITVEHKLPELPGSAPRSSPWKHLLCCELFVFLRALDSVDRVEFIFGGAYLFLTNAIHNYNWIEAAYKYVKRFTTIHYLCRIMQGLEGLLSEMLREMALSRRRCETAFRILWTVICCVAAMSKQYPDGCVIIIWAR